jgi:hypothetical protein
MKSFTFAFLCFFSLISFNLYSQDQVDSTDLVFEKVDIDASYPGGDKEWVRFLQTHLNANVPVDNGAPAGKFTVWVQFIVDKQGNVTEMKTLTHNGYGMEEEVLRILKLVPKWTPASQNGRYVKAYRKQPVTFIIEDESISVEFDNNEEVVYVGVPTQLTISADKVKPHNLNVTISAGTITGSEGKYTIRVNRADRIVLTIYNKDKQVGQYSFLAEKKKSN